LLFAYLLSFPTRRTSREVLAELLWPGQDFDYGRKNLNLTLTRLRKHLEGICPGAEAVIDTSDRTHLALRSELLLPSDRDDLERCLARAESVGIVEGTEVATEDQSAVEILSAARLISDQYVGPLLDGYDEAWIVSERERLQERCVGALRRALRVAYDRRSLDVASDIARSVLRIEPLREGAHRDLIRLLLIQGRIGPARRQLEELECLLRDQGIAPSPATTALAAHLAPPASSTPTLPATHAETVVAMQASTTAPAAAPSPVPFALTRFFGREQEQREVVELLTGNGEGADPHTPRMPRSRLVTLLGPGGNGKTRLAREVALSLHNDPQSPFMGSVWWLALSDVSDVDSLLIQLRVMIRSRNPDGVNSPETRSSSPLDLVAGAIADAGRRSGRESLLILDNAEAHLQAGARIVRALLERVPNLSCLVTSRLPLGLSGEQEFLLEPLTSPPLPPLYGEVDLVELQANPSVQLFLDRMQLVQRRFRLGEANAASVARLCSWLDGSPLAIELAASWGRTFSPQQILDRMSKRRFDVLVSQEQEASERHRSLQAVIETSEMFLSPGARRLFHLLSVFRGGFTLEAVEAVCGIDVSGNRRDDATNTDHDFLKQFQELAAVAFVTTMNGEERYRLLETLREWGTAQLLPRERLHLRRRHAYYYAEAAFVRNAPSTERLLQSAAVGQQWEQETENLVAAWEYFQESMEEQDIGPGLQFARRLYEWLHTRGYRSQMRDRLLRQLERARVATEVAAKVVLVGQEGEGSVAPLPPPWFDDELRALLLLSRREQPTNLEMARHLLDEVQYLVQLYPTYTISVEIQADIYLKEGILRSGKDRVGARLWYEQAIAYCEANGGTDTGTYLNALCILGDLVHITGEYVFQRDLMLRCLQGVRAMEASGRQPTAPQRSAIAYQLALAEIRLRNFPAARRYLHEAATIARNSGNVVTLLQLRWLEAYWHEQSGDDASAAVLARTTLIECRQYDQRNAGQFSLDLLVRVAFRQQNYKYTSQLMGAWSALNVQWGLRGYPPDHPEQCMMRQEIIAAIGVAAYESAWQAGNALTISEIDALVLNPAALEPDTISDEASTALTI